MSSKAALPGLATGALGLAAGMLGYGFEQPMFGAVAGVLALASGVAGLRTAQELREQGAVQTLIEEELRKVRAEARDAEERIRVEVEAETNGNVDESKLDEAESKSDVDPLLDGTTGLFSEGFFSIALDSRIAVARRHLRPVAVVLLEVVEGLPGSDPIATAAETVAEAITITLREADTACRMRNGVFALLLEDTPENGAIWTVERIRRHLAESEPELTLWAGLACYPAHAFGATEVVDAAESALASAREWRQDRIEVAVSAPD